MTELSPTARSLRTFQSSTFRGGCAAAAGTAVAVLLVRPDRRCCALKGTVLMRHYMTRSWHPTVPAACLPRTGFAAAWAPATRAELTCHKDHTLRGACSRSSLRTHAPSRRRGLPPPARGCVPLSPVRAPPLRSRRRLSVHNCSCFTVHNCSCFTVHASLAVCPFITVRATLSMHHHWPSIRP